MTRVLAALALACSATLAQSSGTTTTVLDLSRDASPLYLVQKSAPNVWEVPRCAFAKLASDGWGTALQRSSDPRKPHVSIQAYWLVRELAGQDGAAALGAHFRDIEKFLRRYALEVTVPPAAPQVARSLKAGSLRLDVHGVDLVARTAKRGRTRRVYAYGFAVNGWLVSLVVSHVGDARRSREFLDSVRLTQRPPRERDLRHAQFSSGLDFRLHVEFPKGLDFRRVLRGPPVGVAAWTSRKLGATLRLSASRSVGDLHRMIEGWTRSQKDLVLDEKSARSIRVANGQCLVAFAGSRAGTKPALMAFLERNGVFCVLRLEGDASPQASPASAGAERKRRRELLRKLLGRLDCWLL